MEKLPRIPGVYLLLIRVPRRLEVRVGGLGVKRFAPGCYAYIGSAKGPGGIRARVSRHLSAEKRLRWHIDYLLAGGASVIAVVYAGEPGEPECILTPVLEEAGFTHPVPGFGSSDCRRGCKSHLLACPAGCSRCAELALKAFSRLGLKPVLLLVAREGARRGDAL